MWGDLATLRVCNHNSTLEEQTTKSDNLPMLNVFTVNDGFVRCFIINSARVETGSYCMLVLDVGDVWGYLLDLRHQVLESILVIEDVLTPEAKSKLVVQSPTMCVLDRLGFEYRNTSSMVLSFVILF